MQESLVNDWIILYSAGWFGFVGLSFFWGERGLLALLATCCVLANRIERMTREQGMQQAEPGGRQIWSVLNGVIAGMEVCVMVERDFLGKYFGKEPGEKI